MVIKATFSFSASEIGNTVAQIVETQTTQVGKRALMMQEYVDALRKMNEANEHGDTEEAQRQFVCAGIICNRFKMDEPVDALPMMS